MNGIYTDGTYLEHTGGTWHIEDSSFKAKWIARLLARHPDIILRTVCEIGSGAGAILHELEKVLPESVSFTGYEISPDAHKISKQFVNSRCRFVLGDAFADGSVYDLECLPSTSLNTLKSASASSGTSEPKGDLRSITFPLMCT